jgi:hypothetical protein
MDLEGLLRAAADGSIRERDCIVLMRLLRLPLCYFPAVERVAAQGRLWDAHNLGGYVRVAATREAMKLGLAEVRATELPLVVPAGFRRFPDGTPRSAAAAHDAFIEYVASKYMDECDDEPAPEPHLVEELDYTSGLLVKGREAGFDALELAVLEAKLSGVTRERFIAERPTLPEQRAAAAAWRRFNRHKRMEQVTGTLQNVPK